MAEVDTRVYGFSASFRRGETRNEEGKGFDGALELPCGRDTDLGGAMEGDKEELRDPLGWGV